MKTKNEISDNTLLISVLIIIILFWLFAGYGCTSSQPITDRAQSHIVKYKWCFLGDSVYRYRSADGGPFKMYNKEKSGMRADKETCTEIKYTTEKY